MHIPGSAFAPMNVTAHLASVSSSAAVFSAIPKPMSTSFSEWCQRDSFVRKLPLSACVRVRRRTVCVTDDMVERTMAALWQIEGVQAMRAPCERASAAELLPDVERTRARAHTHTSSRNGRRSPRERACAAPPLSLVLGAAFRL
eukprot:1304954-Pleurochrysis_carterae.AAC.1